MPFYSPGDIIRATVTKADPAQDAGLRIQKRHGRYFVQKISGLLRECQAPLIPGDKILQLNGVPAKRYKSVSEMVESMQNSTMVSIVAERMDPNDSSDSSSSGYDDSDDDDVGYDCQEVHPGDIMQLRGLKQRAKWNGSLVRVLEEDVIPGRWLVELVNHRNQQVISVAVERLVSADESGVLVDSSDNPQPDERQKFERRLRRLQQQQRQQREQYEHYDNYRSRGFHEHTTSTATPSSTNRRLSGDYKQKGHHIHQDRVAGSGGLVDYRGTDRKGDVQNKKRDGGYRAEGKFVEQDYIAGSGGLVDYQGTDNKKPSSQRQSRQRSYDKSSFSTTNHTTTTTRPTKRDGGYRSEGKFVEQDYIAGSGGLVDYRGNDTRGDHQQKKRDGTYRAEGKFVEQDYIAGSGGFGHYGGTEDGDHHYENGMIRQGDMMKLRNLKAKKHWNGKVVKILGKDYDSASKDRWHVKVLQTEDIVSIAARNLYPL